MKKTIFYFAYFGTSEDSLEILLDRLSYIIGQLKFLLAIESKYEFHKIWIVYTAPSFLKDLIAHACQEIGVEVFDSQCTTENFFEYPGFAAMHQYASSLEEEELLFYCHSKGSVNKHPTAIGALKLNLLSNLCCDLSPLESNPALNKAGLFTTISGSIWYNFFWVKSSFMKTVNVDKNENRYRFEQMIRDPRGNSALCIMSDFLREYFGFQKENTFSSHELNQNPRIRSFQQSLGTTEKPLQSLSDLELFKNSLTSDGYPFTNFLLNRDGNRLYYIQNKLVVSGMKSSERDLRIVSYDVVEEDKIHLHIFMGRKQYLSWGGEKFIESNTPSIFQLLADSDGFMSLKLGDRVAILHGSEVTFKPPHSPALFVTYS